MAQFADNVTVDPTTMTISETKAVKKEPNETVASAPATAVTLVGIQVEQTPKS